MLHRLHYASNHLFRWTLSYPDSFWHEPGGTDGLSPIERVYLLRALQFHLYLPAAFELHAYPQLVLLDPEKFIHAGKWKNYSIRAEERTDRALMEFSRLREVFLQQLYLLPEEAWEQTALWRGETPVTLYNVVKHCYGMDCAQIGALWQQLPEPREHQPLPHWWEQEAEADYYTRPPYS